MSLCTDISLFLQRSSILTSASSRISLSSRATLLSSLGRDDGTKRSKKMVVCRVALLDGSTFEPKGVDVSRITQLVLLILVNYLDSNDLIIMFIFRVEKIFEKH